MQYDVSYKGVVAGSFFGRFLQPGQSFRTTASLAVELHEDGSNRWECPKYEEAKSELATPVQDVVIVEVGGGVSIDLKPEPPVVDKPVSGTGVGDLFPAEHVLAAIDSSVSAALPPVATGGAVTSKCDVCGESFPSKKKLAGHKQAVHSGAKILDEVKPHEGATSGAEGAAV